jgi:hypothetical protein
MADGMILKYLLCTFTSISDANWAVSETVHIITNGYTSALGW